MIHQETTIPIIIILGIVVTVLINLNVFISKTKSDANITSASDFVKSRNYVFFNFLIFIHQTSSLFITSALKRSSDF